MSAYENLSARDKTHYMANREVEGWRATMGTWIAIVYTSETIAVYMRYMEFMDEYYFSAYKLQSSGWGTYGEDAIIAGPKTEIYVEDKTLIVVPSGRGARKVIFETQEDAEECKNSLQNVLAERFK